MMGFSSMTKLTSQGGGACLSTTMKSQTTCSKTRRCNSKIAKDSKVKSQTCSHQQAMGRVHRWYPDLSKSGVILMFTTRSKPTLHTRRTKALWWTLSIHTSVTSTKGTSLRIRPWLSNTTILQNSQATKQTRTWVKPIKMPKTAFTWLKPQTKRACKAKASQTATTTAKSHTPNRLPRGQESLQRNNSSTQGSRILWWTKKNSKMMTILATIMKAIRNLHISRMRMTSFKSCQRTMKSVRANLNNLRLWTLAKGKTVGRPRWETRKSSSKILTKSVWLTLTESCIHNWLTTNSSGPILRTTIAPKSTLTPFKVCRLLWEPLRNSMSQMTSLTQFYKLPLSLLRSKWRIPRRVGWRVATVKPNLIRWTLCNQTLRILILNHQALQTSRTPKGKRCNHVGSLYRLRNLRLTITHRTRPNKWTTRKSRLYKSQLFTWTTL